LVSVAVIEIFCSHSFIGALRVIDQVVSERTVVVPIVTQSPFFILIIAPISPVPVIVGVESLVIYGEVVSVETEVTLGERGGVKS
jgi:hypothetical protein